LTNNLALFKSRFLLRLEIIKSIEILVKNQIQNYTALLSNQIDMLIFSENINFISNSYKDLKK